MPTITTKDGAQIFHKDWGSGQPVMFSHGWPLNADAWDEQLYLFATNGYRAIAHRHGTSRVAKAVLVDAVTPGLVHPGGMPLAIFDQIRAGLLSDSSQFWEDVSQPFYGANRPGAKVSKGTHDRFWLLALQVWTPRRA